MIVTLDKKRVLPGINRCQNSFTMENGVKQGGVIFPIFFSIYIDPLLLQLRNSGYGVYGGPLLCR